MIADLNRVTKKWDESARQYDELMKMSPGRPEAVEGAGWLALYQRKNPEAFKYLAHAIELGSQGPAVFQHTAPLGWNDPKRALGYMQRAVELDPDFKYGNLTIGRIALNAQDPQAALIALKKIKVVRPDQASSLFRFLGYAYLETHDMPEARKNADLAKRNAKTDEDRSGALDLLTYFDRAERPQPRGHPLHCNFRRR